MPRRALLHALTAGEHSDKPRAFIFAGNGADFPLSAMCQSAYNVTLVDDRNKMGTKDWRTVCVNNVHRSSSEFPFILFTVWRNDDMQYKQLFFHPDDFI